MRKSCVSKSPQTVKTENNKVNRSTPQKVSEKQNNRQNDDILFKATEHDASVKEKQVQEDMEIQRRQQIEHRRNLEQQRLQEIEKQRQMEIQRIQEEHQRENKIS